MVFTTEMVLLGCFLLSTPDKQQEPENIQMGAELKNTRDQ